MDGEKVGWTTYKANLPCIGSAGLEFNFTTPPDVATMAACTDSEMMAAVCKAMGVVKGKNRATMAENLVKYMVDGGVVKKKGSTTATGGGKTELLKQAAALDITHGIKVSGKQAGKTVVLGELNMVELESEIAKAKFAAAATAAATAAVQVVVDNSDEEVEDEEVGSAEEEGGEEEAQDDVDEVIYLAHL